MLAACTPKMDWRDVRQENAGWQATFPGKPVTVSRKLAPHNTHASVTLTLTSARIDDAMYAVGWINDAKPGISKSLQEAMLANIEAKPESVRRTSASRQGMLMHDIRALGTMRLDPAGPAVQARLWMRSVEIAAPASVRFIEIVVVGPASQIKDDDAEQFLDSLQLF